MDLVTAVVLITRLVADHGAVEDRDAWTTIVDRLDEAEAQEVHQ